MNNIEARLHAEFNDFAVCHGNEYFAPLVKFIEEKYPLVNKAVLEFGCGTGELSILLSRHGAKKVIGIDVSDPAINEAKKNVEQIRIKNIEFISGNIMDMDWNYPLQDMIISNSVLHYIPGDLQPILKQLHRILKPNGTLLATFEVSNRFNLVRIFQWINLLFIPKVIQNFLYGIIILLFYLMLKIRKEKISWKMLRKKMRYLGIPVVQSKSVAELENDLRSVGFLSVSIEMAPSPSFFSTSHYFIKAQKNL